MSEAEQQDGATQAPEDATNAGKVATEEPGKSVDAVGGADSATGADGSNGGAADEGNAAGGASTGSAEGDMESAQGAQDSNDAADPNASAGADPANPSAPQSAGSDANASDGESLLAKVESLALAAFNSGKTEEHNLMAWLHSHLIGAKSIVAGADQLDLSDEARAVVAKVKGLL